MANFRGYHTMILSFVFAFFSTLGFCILFHVPIRHIIPASFVGGSGWLIYTYLTSTGSHKILACFVGACGVAILSDIFSRTFKDASTIFIIPGILPLVPGAGMYYTMLAILDGDLEKLAVVGTETIFMAGAIAVGLLVVASIARIVTNILKNISLLRHS
jgi:uncharacterized membrane protein YjjB (DUF3815 family)